MTTKPLSPWFFPLALQLGIAFFPLQPSTALHLIHVMALFITSSLLESLLTYVVSCKENPKFLEDCVSVLVRFLLCPSCLQALISALHTYIRHFITPIEPVSNKKPEIMGLGSVGSYSAYHTQH